MQIEVLEQVSIAMRIEKLELSNYRGFQNVSLKLGPMNVVVGENNVGKSTLLALIQMVSSIPYNAVLPREFWPDSQPTSDITVSAEFTLGKDEMERIAYETDFSEDGRPRLGGEALAERFGNQVELTSNWHRPDQASRTTLAFLKNRSHTIVEPNLGGHRSNQGQTTFGSQTFQALRTIMVDAMIHVPEFRQRPQASAEEIFRAPEGTRVTGVLFSLKNGTRDQQDRYNQIKDHFSKLFPSLRMELTRTGGPAKIMVENIRTLHEVPLDTLGAGIAEMIIILTHVEGEIDKVFSIDEPELHMHPHSQRLLRRVLRESLAANQVILATHSSHFVDLKDAADIIVIRELGGRSRVTKLEENYLTDDEKRRVSRILQSEEKEFLFSRRVLLVEGPTEYGAMPILARKLHRDFDENGVSVVFVGGNYFALFLKLLKGYDFPWRSICDRDVLMNITCKFRIDGAELKASHIFEALMAIQQLTASDKELLSACQDRVNKQGEMESFDEAMFNSLSASAAIHGFHVISPDFEGFLRANGHESLFREAAQMYGRSKVLQGRYVAERMDTIPPELELAIREMTPDVN